MGRGHGTINVVKGKAYIVLSVSVSVFAESDAAQAVADGILTAGELTANHETLRTAIRKGLTLRQGKSPVKFGSILLNLPKGDHHPKGKSAELTAMIVAPLNGAIGKTKPIEVKNTLWGPPEKRLKLKATITQSGKTVRSEIFELTPTKNRHQFFAKN